MKPVLIKGGRLIDPAACMDRIGDLLIQEDSIVWIGQGELPGGGVDVINAAGLIVCPGFIDLHCHLREPGFESKETIATGTLAAARGGFTTLCAMPNTAPPTDSASTVRYVKSTAKRQGIVRVLPIACVTRGQKGTELVNMRDLVSSGAAAFSDDGKPVIDSGIMRAALETAKELAVPIIDHCEDLALTRSGYMNEGALAHKLGIGGMPAAAEEIMVARDLALAAVTGGHIHIAHVSTEGSVELIRRAKQNSVKVTAEATPHHLTLTEDTVVTRGSLAKVNPPLRTMRDVQAVVQGLREGVIDAIATDHAPHTKRDKGRDFTKAAFGISGFETALGSLMRLVHDGKLSLSRLIAALTCAPARIMSINQLGSLQAGVSADITLIDPNREWTVDVDTFASKGKNSPLHGETMRGKVVATVYGGNLVYKDDIISARPGENVELEASKRPGAAQANA